MKLSYNWLKEYVNTKFSAEVIAEKLTMAGLEVEEVISDTNFTGVIVGKVLSVDSHPNADKLRVAKVDIKTEVLQIVCGANNLGVGQSVAVATVGAKLGDFEISKASLRGVDSHGMICSEKELGLGDDHNGIMVLDKSYKVGEEFVSQGTNDKIIDVNVLANRPDCMSVIGLAREVSALTLEKLNIKTPKVIEVPAKEKLSIKVEDTTLCPRYMSRIVTNVVRNESPEWMKQRLAASGIRSIDILVDISNYVMLEYGQPLHFFDLDKLVDKTIVVRPAKSGESIVTLDGQKRKLTTDNLVIANKKEPIAIAGVMGGLTTEISDKTENIFIEAAVFEKASIRKTSRVHNLRSEAVARYEKGIGLYSPEMAIERAAELLVELAYGTVCGAKTDSLVQKPKCTIIALNPSRLNAFLGTKYTDSKIKDVLYSLGFSVTTRTKYLFEVTVPSWRVDVVEYVDLYEEVARVIGFDSIPSTLPFSVRSLSKRNDSYEFTKKVRHQLAAIGLSEIMTYSFASEHELSVTKTDPKDAYELANPLVKEQRYMRTSLAPKMLESLAANQYLAENVGFFELGKTFHRESKGLPMEKSLLAIGVIGGQVWPIQYTQGQEYYQVKGLLENLFESLVIRNTTFKAKDDILFELGRSAEILLGNDVVGILGEVDASVSRKFGLKKASALAIVDLEKLLGHVATNLATTAISKYQQSVRDISFVISTKLEASRILDTLAGSDKLIKKIEIVDIYEGKPLEVGERSITVRITIISSDRTLNEDEVETVVAICQSRVEKLGGKVRGAKK